MKLRILLILFIVFLTFYVGKTEMEISQDFIYVNVTRPFLAIGTFFSLAFLAFLTIGPVKAKQ